MSTRVSRFIAIMFVILFPLVALAGNDVGKISGNGSGVEWALTRSGHDSIQLTVTAPDGTTYQKTFNGNATPRFTTGDLKKTGAVDGVYNYELRVIPAISSQVKAALKAARANGDDAGVAEIMRANGLSTTVTQSGAFGIDHGFFINPDAVEPDANESAAAAPRASTTSAGTTAGTRRLPGTIAADDQVIADDLIVQSSICAGFDCVSGESFGFDTIRMKENNLQLAYDDTSSSAGFPNNDWNIVANDTASGGQSYLAFTDVTAGRKPFTVEAASPANALYVDSTGNIGLSTSSPGLDLHLSESDTPAIRLEQTNAGGFTAQTWDIGANEANFFVRDLTGGSRLPFRIRPGAPTSSIDIAASGNVGIATASPESLMHLSKSVTGAVGPVLFIDNPGFSTLNNSASIVLGTSTGANPTTVRTAFIDAFVSNASTGATSVKLGGWNGSAEQEWVRLDAGGNTSIGTTITTSRLNVGGDIRTIGGSFIDDGVTLAAPDWVFENTYKLMPIDEVSSFIKANKHLPNIPSADQIKSSGLNMSQFQMRLLEKVEELTLYTVSQHEQIGSLKTQNDQLMQRLAALEAQVAKKP